MTETESEALKQQFQLLQEQQQKKLLRRKQKKEEKEKSNLSSTRSNTTTSIAFGIEDDLGLKLSDPSTKQTSYLSEDLVEHLNEQIRELKDENARVYKLLSEKDFEVRQMKKKAEDKARVTGAVTNETAASKIVDLSKKVRELTAELESEKTKSKQYAKKCIDLQKQLSNIPEETRSNLGSVISLKSQAEENGEDHVDIKALQDKVKYAENKMAEHRNQCSFLKQELKTAHKVLAQEVGDNVDIKSILNSPSGWKGRAQQIVNLQKKVDELKYELTLANKAKTSDIDLESEILGSLPTSASTTGNSSARQRGALERQREQIRKLEKERKDASEKSATELKNLEEELSALKKKFDAAKTRNGVLSNQAKGLKEQMKTLIEKGHHDDELIQALMKQQTQLRYMLDETTRNQRETTNQKEAEIKMMSMKTQQDNNVVEQLKNIVTEKEAKVHRLEEEIQQLKLNHIQKSQIDSANMLFYPPPGAEGQQAEVHSSRPPTVTHSNYGDEQVDVEFRLNSITPSQSSMSDRPPSINSALDRCPSVNSTIVDSARPMSRKSVKSPAPPPQHKVTNSNNVDKAALAELDGQCREYKTLLQVAEVERDRLSELVKILQKRADENVMSLSESQGELLQQRKKNAILEKQLGKAKIESKSSGSLTNRKRGGVNVSQSFAVPDDDDLDNVEEIKTNLELQKDENEALKAALQSTLKAKEQDMKMFTELMEETKRVFLQALRQYKQNIQGT
ncbi:hypothetical protein FSP39_018431 [Pinctada imbricata]|uniref:Coiled-coil domain-containing protein 13 n=1 Tax=Pinctada imbricata TaxID=66713 RepID=A0AA89CCU6_PINIB|nr:hypothetical protein FSP39_018431 [Pinctada imbricata]